MKQFFTFLGLFFFLFSQAEIQPRVEEVSAYIDDFHYDYEQVTPVNSATESFQERILLFRSDIKVTENADVLVTETIKVYAKGQEIKRGLFRALPMVRNTKNGKEKITYKILSVKKDGVTEEYHTETVNKVSTFISEIKR